MIPFECCKEPINDRVPYWTWFKFVPTTWLFMFVESFISIDWESLVIGNITSKPTFTWLLNVLSTLVSTDINNIWVF